MFVDDNDLSGEFIEASCVRIEWKDIVLINEPGRREKNITRARTLYRVLRDAQDDGF
jgi:hypothetical protein